MTHHRRGFGKDALVQNGAERHVGPCVHVPELEKLQRRSQYDALGSRNNSARNHERNAAEFAIAVAVVVTIARHYLEG